MVLLSAGIAGAATVLVQTVRHGREANERMAAIRLAESLAEDLRVLRRPDGRALGSVADFDPAVGSDDEFDGLEYGPIVGARFELNAYNDFFVEYRYTLFSGDLDDVFDESHGIFFGIICQFK